MAWLQLIRWKNLLIIFLTQLLVWWFVLFPDRHHEGSPLLLGPRNFLLLALSTVLIAAAGYIINDYFDVKIDIINRPEKMVLEKSIPRRHAIILHSVLNVVAIFLALIVARAGGHYEWIWIQLVCSLLLWFYSTHFKQRFMIGNVVVALLTSLTILVLVVYSPAMHKYINREVFAGTARSYHSLNPLWLLSVYSYFAFMLTWMREIVKDMEDFKGDAEEGCMTMPIKWGLEKAVRFTRILGGLAVLPLAIACYFLTLSGNYILAAYTGLLVMLPLLVWLFNLGRKATTEHYATASSRIKIIMLLGVGTLIINYLEEWLRSY